MQMSANFNLNLDHLTKLFYTSTFFFDLQLPTLCEVRFYLSHNNRRQGEKIPLVTEKYKEKNSNKSSEPNKKGTCLIASKTV